MFETMKALYSRRLEERGDETSEDPQFLTGTTVKRLDRRQVFSPEG